MKQKHYRSLLYSSVVFMTVLGLMVYLSSFAFGEEKEEKALPPRKISVAPEYTGVVVDQGEAVSVDLDVTDGGRQPENVQLTMATVPKGWDARIKTYSFGVTGVYLDSDKSKTLTLKAEPDKDVGPGTYAFVVKAKSKDGELTSTSQLNVTVKKGEKKKSTGVNVTTSYPVLTGPTDAKFEFSMEVENKTDKDAIFNLAAQGPDDWTINFKPAYEDKYFSSLRIKANQSQTMGVLVKPSPLADPGKYPIKVKVGSDKAKTEAELTVVISGTQKLEVATGNGLLSLNALQGKASNVSFYVKNTGSALENNVRFVSFKPENWKVNFKPENIKTLPPGELKQVEAIITPADQSLVGDYSVGLNVKAGKVSKDLEMRVTVRPSSAWGWFGIGIIVFVLGGLVVLFVKMGRR